jgi:hypothetical protein
MSQDTEQRTCSSPRHLLPFKNVRQLSQMIPIITGEFNTAFQLYKIAMIRKAQSPLSPTNNLFLDEYRGWRYIKLFQENNGSIVQINTYLSLEL